ncbi:MAG: AAA family ATPase [Deltaproteobacteria bacterium]|nr:AAA family ATPase [Deltaproteobacteria bacterium]
MDYEAFFKLKERPFKNPLEARYFFRVPVFDRLTEALSQLPKPSLLILKGPAGSGKTTMLRNLARTVKDRVIVAPILQTGYELRDILSDALFGFGLGFKCAPQVPEESLLGFFQNAVSSFLASGLDVILAADRAGHLEPENLTELIDLVNLEPVWSGRTGLLLSTRPEPVWPIQKFPDARIIEVPPLDLEQTKAYVRYRMRAAGARKDYFKADSLITLHKLSGGIPMEINNLAERALMTAWAAGRKEVSSAHLFQAKTGLENPPRIDPKAIQQAAGRKRGHQKIKSWPARLSLAVFMALVFSLGLIFWPKFQPEEENSGRPPDAAQAAAGPAEAEVLATATPAAEPALPGQTPGLGLPSPPPALLRLPHNTMALVVDQSLNQARLWQGQLKKPGLKAELPAPDFEGPGLYLVGRPKSRLSLIFQYPPGKEVPPVTGEKLWRQVETLLPQDILPLIVADSQLLLRPVPPEDLDILKEKLKTWTTAQEVKFTDNLALLYTDPFVFYEPGQRPQTISRENFKVALTSEARTSGDVKLAISEPLLMLDPRNHNRAWAVFSLKYDSRLRHDIGLRTLIFEKSMLGDWYIKAELWIRENSLEN